MPQEHGLAPDETARRLKQRKDGNHLKDTVYGGIDGAETTSAIVAGVEGAGLSPDVIIALGIGATAAAFAYLVASLFR